MYDGTIRDSLAPIKATAPRRINVPAGAWDTHAHVIGDQADHDFVPTRHFNPAPATVADFIAMLDQVGITYGALVQASVHGTDNTLLLQSLRSYPARLKGIAVIDLATSDAELETLNAGGVVGIRILDIVGGGVGLENLEALADRCARIGWHIQLGLKGEVFPKLVDRLTRLPVPFVIDHMGWVPTTRGVASTEFQALMTILRNAQCYVKLSGAFRVSTASRAPYADTFEMAQTLMQAAPDRMVWGSDWPHVGLYDPADRPDVGALLDWIADALPDPADQKRILVDNPAAVYGVPGARAG